jgi:hypothetical protein
MPNWDLQLWQYQERVDERARLLQREAAATRMRPRRSRPDGDEARSLRWLHARFDRRHLRGADHPATSPTST